MSESGSEPKAVIDTNLFVSSAIGPFGPPAELINAWIERRFRLLLSDLQRAEVADVFARPSLARRFRLAPRKLDELLDGLLEAETAPLHPHLPIRVRDPDDDLLSLGGDPRLGDLKIVTAVEFLAVLASLDGDAEG